MIQVFECQLHDYRFASKVKMIVLKSKFGIFFFRILFCDVEKSINSKEHKIIADMLYQLRIASGLKQAELAVLLGEPQSFVSKFESGERRLDLVELRIILMHLKTNLADFISELEGRMSKT